MKPLHYLKKDTATEDEISSIFLNYLTKQKYFSYKYEDILTYYDELVLLAILKGSEVLYNEDDVEYYLDGKVVSDAVEKLISKGFINATTLVPNINILRRVYVKDLFVNYNKMETFTAYQEEVINKFLFGRSKWTGFNSYTTILKAMHQFIQQLNKNCTFSTTCYFTASLPFEDTNRSRVCSRNIRVLNETIITPLLSEIQQFLK